MKFVTGQIFLFARELRLMCEHEAECISCVRACVMRITLQYGRSHSCLWGKEFTAPVWNNQVRPCLSFLSSFYVSRDTTGHAAQTPVDTFKRCGDVYPGQRDICAGFSPLELSLLVFHERIDRSRNAMRAISSLWPRLWIPRVFCSKLVPENVDSFPEMPLCSSMHLSTRLNATIAYSQQEQAVPKCCFILCIKWGDKRLTSKTGRHVK